MWNVDFQGDTNSGGLFGQNDVAKNYGPDASGIWNHFVITALSANPQTIFANNPSMDLVDNDGAASPVTVTLNGMYAGWNGAATDHPLFGDYVIILGNGTLGFPSPPLNLSITGLTPGVDYGLRVISGNVSIVRDLFGDDRQRRQRFAGQRSVDRGAVGRRRHGSFVSGRAHRAG